MQQNPREGTKLGAYTLIRLIARGGMGEVYEAHESKLQRLVALKLIAPTNPNEHDQDELIRRFMLEARTLAKINHPNVVTIYAIDNIVDVPFIAMEYVDGVAFRELIEQFTFTADGAAPLFLQMCDGLKALHDNQIIHRDLKPHNILLRRDGQVKILDFGIAKREGGADQTRAGIVVGTLPYMPPEVKSGAPASPRSDIWSLGAIFFECLTGDRLVTAQAEAPKGVEVPFTKEEIARIPPEMRAIITKMCAARPAQRYQSTSEVIEDLRAFRRDRPQVAAGMWEHLTKKIDEISEANKKIANAEAPRVQFTQLLAKQAREDHTPVSGEIRDITGERQRAQSREQTFSPAVRTQTRRWWIVPGAAVVLAAAFVMKVRQKIEPAVPSPPLAASSPVLPTAPIPTALPPTNPRPLTPPAPAVDAVVIETPALIEPLANASLWLDPELVPTFAWSRLLDRGEYKIEISTDRTFKDIRVSEPVSGGSFRPSRPLEDGGYFWRLKPVQPQREAVGPIAFNIKVVGPIALIAPGGQERFPLRPREDAFPVHFAWTCQKSARRYQLEVSQFGAARPLVDQATTGCEASPRAFAPGSYRWRVRAEAQAGAPAAIWSETRTFVVEAPAASAVTQNTARPRPAAGAPALGEPKLISSVVNATLPNGRPRLRWRKVTGARQYQIQIASSRDFNRPIVDERTSGTEYDWSDPTPGKTYWRVAAVNGDDRGPISERGQIETFVAPPSLNSHYRLNNANFEFGGIPSAERYVVQTGRTRDLAQAQSQTSVRPRVTLDDQGGTYFVRVAAANASGDLISSFSNLAQVDVNVTRGPRPPALLTPPARARAPARQGRISIIFSWDASEGAESYVLEISNDQDFRRVIERKPTRERGAVYKQAALSGRVYWRVRAKGRQGLGEWTSTAYFDVID